MNSKTIRVFSAIAIAAFLAAVFFKMPPSDSVSFAITFAVFAYIFYDCVLWRINPFEKTPRLHRKYISEQVSSHNEYRYKVNITVIQTLSTIRVTENWLDAKGRKSRSQSIAAAMIKDGSEWKLCYTYRTEPAVRLPSEPCDDPHYGTTILHVKDRNNLEGRYFTGRHQPTTGSATWKRSK